VSLGVTEELADRVPARPEDKRRGRRSLAAACTYLDVNIFVGAI
jgi:hypothetical protein